MSPYCVAEAQLAHAVEREGMLLHCLQVNGDPIDSEALDAFAQDVVGRFQQRPPVRRPTTRPGG